jgi:rhodanese-related sulfurtransferase
MNKNYLIGLIIILGLAGFFLIRSQSTNTTSTDGRFDSGVNSVNAVEFTKLAKNENAFLLDVHIPEQTHIPGTDAFIPYNEISENIVQLPQDKNSQILVYCRSGSMSKEAAFELQEMGYTNVIDLAGGMNAYKEANLSVSISPSTKDLGTVIYGDVATVEFTLSNFTPQPLSITKVSTSCGCTSAEVENESLEPYESTTVHVSFDPAVHKDDTDLGELTRTIYIDTDNPNFSQITSTITANVVKK